MEKNIVSSKQLSYIMILFILGSSLITGTGSVGKQDSWICIIIGMFMAIPLVLIYSRISKLFPQKNIYDIIYHIFGKTIATIICILYIFYSIQLGAAVIRNFTEYIQITSLPETPQYIFAIFMGAICFWTLKHGIESLGRGCIIVLPIVVLIVLFTIVFTIKDMNLSNLKPILGQDFKTILSGSFGALTFPFGEVVLFMVVLSSLKPKESPYKVYLKSIFIGGFILVIAMIRNILVLGVPIMDSLHFPSYYTASILDIGDFVSRIEILIAGNFIISGLVKITICLYASVKGVARIFKIDNFKQIIAPIVLFMIVLSQLIYTNTMQMFEFIKTTDYYFSIFQIVLPIIILIFSEVKVRKNKKALKCDQVF
ncbi:MAG: endospore germination permease [Oscillospiraceae bacterium]